METWGRVLSFAAQERETGMKQEDIEKLDALIGQIRKAEWEKQRTGLLLEEARLEHEASEDRLYNARNEMNRFLAELMKR